MHVYMCSVYSRFVHMHVYMCACIHMYHVYAEGLGFRDQGSGPDLHMHVCIHVYVYMYICVFVSIYVGACNICIPTGCICSLHICL